MNLKCSGQSLFRKNKRQFKNRNLKTRTQRKGKYQTKHSDPGYLQFWKLFLCTFYKLLFPFFRIERSFKKNLKGLCHQEGFTVFGFREGGKQNEDVHQEITLARKKRISRHPAALAVLRRSQVSKESCSLRVLKKFLCECKLVPRRLLPCPKWEFLFPGGRDHTETFLELCNWPFLSQLLISVPSLYLRSPLPPGLQQFVQRVFWKVPKLNLGSRHTRFCFRFCPPFNTCSLRPQGRHHQLTTSALVLGLQAILKPPYSPFSLRRRCQILNSVCLALVTSALRSFSQILRVRCHLNAWKQARI